MKPAAQIRSAARCLVDRTCRQALKAAEILAIMLLFMVMAVVSVVMWQMVAHQVYCGHCTEGLGRRA
jgi:hypothetical protein